MKWLLLLLFFLIIPLNAEEELIVRLTAKEERLPVFVSIFSETPDVDKKYVEDLEKVLKFDLDHNGRTGVMSANKEMLSLFAQEKDLMTYNRMGWKSQGAHFVIKAKIDRCKLSASVFSVEKNDLKALNDIEILGKLTEDRKTIHKISDAIHEALFNEKGIASSRILFTSGSKANKDPAKWTAEVWQADYDGANAKQLTHENALCVTPVFIPLKPHCKDFLFVSYKIGQPKIYSGSVDGHAYRLSFLKGNQLMPSISPKKDCLAFICDITGNPDLFIQNFSLKDGLVGKPRQIFCAPGGVQGSPCFSPDGNKIAFVSNKDGTARVYILNIPPMGADLKDVKPTLISKQNRDNTSPAWSPDGKKIAFSSLTKGTRQIWIYDVATKKETQLTDGPGHKENPAWASNSLHLLFNSASPNGCDLYLMNLNQKQAVKITSGSQEKRFPAWEC